jgi:hypothetical protein
MKKMMMVAACVGGLACMLACNKEEVGAYTPLPKIHLGETFKYKCEPENYIRLEYDTLGEAAVLNFYKDEITSLDYLEYDENSCTFSFHKGEIVSVGSIHRKIPCGYFTGRMVCGTG